MANEIKVDFLVLGGGSGGVRAARVASQLGAKVALIERDALGGTCVNRGCIPKKFLVYASSIGRELAKIQKGAYGWRSGAAELNWNVLRDRMHAEIKRLNSVYGKTLTTNNVQVFEGDASFVDAHRVRAGNQLFYADKILIAVGGVPVHPEIEGAQHAMVSDDMFEMPHMPDSLLVVGGGYIALEFANIFDGLGVQTCLAYRGDLFLRGFDDSLRTFLRESMETRGMDMRFGVTPVRIAKHAKKGLEVEFDDGSTMRSDAVMYAIGRRPIIDGLGLDEIGVRTDTHGQIEVDAGYTTSVPHIYALGDVVAGMGLTPVAIVEAESLVHSLYGNIAEGADLANVPTAVFSRPELATVGMTEHEARAIHPETAVYEAKFTPLRAYLMEQDPDAREKVLMKIIATSDTESAPIVGAHIAGSGAAEMIQMVALAIKSGATLTELVRTVPLHPTTAEEFVTLYKPRRAQTS